MERWNVLVTVPEPLRGFILTDEALSHLKSFADVTLNEDGHNWTAKEIAERLSGVDAMITGWGIVPLTTEVLSGADRLRVVAHAAGSVKGFATDAVFDRGIIVTHSAGRIADAVAEFTLTMALIGLKRPHLYDRMMKSGVDWPKTRQDPVFEMAGKCVGLLGFGYVGRRTARLFQAVGARVCVYDPYLSQEKAAQAGVRKAELAELLGACAIVSVHLPVTDETHHMLGSRELGLLQDGAVFINTARAWTVDQEALIDELAAGRFWAALDVFDPEPLPVDSPLRSMDNVFLTPHMAGLTRESYQDLMALMIDEIERIYLGQEPQFRVTRDMLATMA